MKHVFPMFRSPFLISAAVRKKIAVRDVERRRVKRVIWKQTQLGSRLGLVVLDGLHRGEEKDFLDVVAVGQEHRETIHAEAPAAGGRQAVLQRHAEVLVQTLGLLVAVALVLRARAAPWGC